jgi:hypothetical protein
VNDEMVQGYLDGRDPNAPEPSANRSASYRHGFRNGRDEILKLPPRASFEKVSAMAEEADAQDRANGWV